MTVIGGTAGDVGECVTQVSAVENGKAVSGSGKTYVTLTEALAEVREGEPRFGGHCLRYDASVHRCAECDVPLQVDERLPSGVYGQ